MSDSEAATNTEHVVYSVANGVATIALNDPSTRNSLSNDMLDGLINAFEKARDDDSVQAVVLASTNDKTFSSGGNLAGFAGDVPLVHKHAGTERFPKLFLLIGELGKPVLCRAQGHVLAGSLGLALACDLIVAGESATFGTPEINVGTFPFMIMALIYRNVGRKKATELLLLGERIDAAEAERIGIVNKVVPDAELDEAVDYWAMKLASRSPLLMKMGKDAIHRQQDMPLEEALEYLRHNLTLAFSTDDLKEGVAAFFEKRDPEWTGK
jgi:1,4-dihydroxy-2-naphthoyl-CoA synthase